MTHSYRYNKYDWHISHNNNLFHFKFYDYLWHRNYYWIRHTEISNSTRFCLIKKYVLHACYFQIIVNTLYNDNIVKIVCNARCGLIKFPEFLEFFFFFFLLTPIIPCTHFRCGYTNVCTVWMSGPPHIDFPSL